MNESDPIALHVLVVLAVSIGFEALFLHHGLNPMDEGWPLHAAMELQAGKTLYSEVFWVFPPGHLLPAWIAHVLAPPGLILARIFYAGFAVTLSIAVLFIARKLMRPEFALLAALMVAICAPGSHAKQLLFGYRYLVFSALALLLLHRRLETGDSRWLGLAGAVTGIALCFRLTPAAAVGVGIGLAVMAASRSWRSWLRDWSWYGAGILVVIVPLALWFHRSVGLDVLWVEMFVRPVEMTDLQSLGMPGLYWRGWTRSYFTRTYLAWAFRIYLVLYAGMAVYLAVTWLRALRERRSYEHVFLLAVVCWGGLFYVRVLGRSDIPHLDSAMPPVALLLAYLVSRLGERAAFLQGAKAARRRWLLVVVVLCLWSYCYGSDRFLDRDGMMGDTPIGILDGRVKVRERSRMRILDRKVPLIKLYADPDDTLFVMLHAPLIYVLAERHSPGSLDFVMPGTYRSEAEERRALARLMSDPPAVVLRPGDDFDGVPERGLAYSAPLISEWVDDHYRPIGDARWFQILVPANAPREAAPR